MGSPKTVKVFGANTEIGAAGLAFLTGISLFSSGYIRVFVPYSPVLFILSVYCTPIGAVFLPTIAYWVWCWFSSTSSKATAIVAASIGLLSLVWFWYGWALGLQYEGALYTRSVALLDAVAAVGILVQLRYSTKSPSVGKILASKFLIVAWVITYAFPWLGEFV
jgi:hypothetical protein